MQAFERKKYPTETYGRAAAERELFSFKAVATRTFFRVAVARIAYVNFGKGTVITGTVILTFGNAAADTGVHFLMFHNKNLLLFESSMRKYFKDY